MLRGSPSPHFTTDDQNTGSPGSGATAGKENVRRVNVIADAEGFSFCHREIPGLYVFVGRLQEDLTVDNPTPRHTPEYRVSGRGLRLAARAHADIVVGDAVGEG
jgi:metal-dependent amidase/aminoacylase/carboxypeptidase family protein